MRFRNALALGLVATAASGVFATAPAEAATVCVTNAPVTGCVHVVENGCAVYGGGAIGSTGVWQIACIPI
jgi:hypothetical protein